MAEKARKVCKNCGYLTTSKECESCGSKEFLPKYKGRAIIVNLSESEIGKKINAQKEGNYALKYGQSQFSFTF